MRYKIGDKVKIKTWTRLEKEFGKTLNNSINTHCHFSSYMERFLREYIPNRIVTIAKIDYFNNSYKIKASGKEYAYKNYDYSDDMIDGWEIEKIYEPTYSRFEILDIR